MAVRPDDLAERPEVLVETAKASGFRLFRRRSAPQYPESGGGGSNGDAPVSFTSSSRNGRPMRGSAWRLLKPGQRKATKPRPRASWQNDAWEYFDDIPEIKFPVRYSGNVMGKARWFAAVLDVNDPESTPIPVTDENANISPALAASATAEVERLHGPLGGIQEIVREFTMNLEIAGECYLVGLGERVVPPDPYANPPRLDEEIQPEEWAIHSVSEVEYKDETYIVKDAPDAQAGRKLDNEYDTVIRFWYRHPRWSMLADANMRGVLGECEALVLLSNLVKAEPKQRMNGGVLVMSNNMTTGSDDSAEPDDAEEAAVAPLIQSLYDGLTEPIEDPSSPSAVAPTVLQGPDDSITPDKLRFMPYERPMAQYLDERIEQRVIRIARGMDFPVEVTVGLKATTFANAEQVDEDTYIKHFEPKLIFESDAFSTGFLQPNLIDSGFSPDEVANVVMWFDPSAMLKQPDTAASADTGLLNGSISHEAWRRVNGWSDADAPDAIERLQNLVTHLRTLDPEMQRTIMDTFASGINFPQPAAVQSSAAASPEPAAALVSNLAAAAALPAPARSNLGYELMLLDRALRDKLLVAADRAMTRALERAGARLRSKIGPQDRELVRRVRSVEVGRLLGPARLAAAGLVEDELIGGDAFDELGQQFMTWGAAAQEKALAMVSRAVGLSQSQVEQFQLRQADSLETAWSWLHEQLHALAEAGIYKPEPLAPRIGEFDPTSTVPTGLIRQALSRAGGATGLDATPQGGVFVATNNGAPAGGIGTGELMQGALADGGGGIEGYLWVYGPAYRAHPFEPHEDLDGETFEDWDAEVLVSGDDWIGDTYFPGDHDGCACDVVPIILEDTLTLSEQE